MIAEADALNEKPKAPGVETSLDSMAHHLRELVRREATGPLAALRRLDAERPVAPAFHQLLAHCAPDRLHRTTGASANAPGGEADMMRRFARIAQIMALRPDALQRYGLGTALHDNGVSPARLAMLLTARGETFNDIARRIARRLANGEGPLPYNELGRLLLYDGRAEHDDKAENIRLRIAADYQRASRPRKDESDDQTAQ